MFKDVLLHYIALLQPYFVMLLFMLLGQPFSVTNETLTLTCSQP